MEADNTTQATRRRRLAEIADQHRIEPEAVAELEYGKVTRFVGVQQKERRGWALGAATESALMELLERALSPAEEFPWVPVATYDLDRPVSEGSDLVVRIVRAGEEEARYEPPTYVGGPEVARHLGHCLEVAVYRKDYLSVFCTDCREVIVTLYNADIEADMERCAASVRRER